MPIGLCCVGVDTKFTLLYNASMTTIVITDSDRASQAGAWAVENIGYKYWDIDTVNLFTTNVQYHFRFKRKKDAVMFSLKWL